MLRSLPGFSSSRLPTGFPSSNLIIELVLIAQIGTISGIDPVGYIRVKFANFDGI
jgi:hypothetical protein